MTTLHRPRLLSDPRGVARGEAGMALATVMIASIALIGLGVAVLGLGLGSQSLSRHDQDWNAALAAAEAGIDDFVFRSNNDDNYYLTAQFDTTNCAVKGWTLIADPNAQPCPTPGTGPEFHYSWTPPSATHSVVLTSTGRVRGVTRTVRATLRHRSFLDGLYTSDYETKDPALYGGIDGHSPFWAGPKGRGHCSRHWYEQAPGRVDKCNNPPFFTGDVLDGPVTSNDALNICGSPQFTDTVQTSFDPLKGVASGTWSTDTYRPPSVDGQRWLDFAGRKYSGSESCPVSGPSTPSFPTGSPSYNVPVAFPATIAGLKGVVWNKPGNPTQGYGCLFSGATAFTFTSAGLYVDAPYSTVLSAGDGCPIKVPSGTGALCGVGYQPPEGTRVKRTCDKQGTAFISGFIPKDYMTKGYGLTIYVQNLPRWTRKRGVTRDPNADPYCKIPHLGGGVSPNVPRALGYPEQRDRTPRRKWYYCRAGNAFVSGLVPKDARVTIATDHNITLGTSVSPEVNDGAINHQGLHYDGGLANNTVVGLLADGSVWVYHPYRCLSTSPSRGCNLVSYGETTSDGSTGLVVQAAILADNGSFFTGGYTYGAQLGSLEFDGSVTQRYHGPIGVALPPKARIVESGFVSLWHYDKRLKHMEPPDFLAPQNATWGVATWAEIPTPPLP